MMQALTLSQVQALTGGVLTGNDVSFRHVSTDTRSLQAGDLFVALRGPNFNGNQFVGVAADKSAAAAVVSEALDTSLPTLQVVDTRIALGQLGRENRLRSAATVIALTGSQGKTTVKEMTAAILREAGPVLSTQGNLNNDFGVPLTLLRLSAEHRYAVIEMGANAGGEIAYTTSLALPDIAHITCVAPTHVEGFGSLAGVAVAKAEIWQGLRDGATAIVNLDDDNVMQRFSVRDGVKIVLISAGGKADADYRLTDFHDHGLSGCSFTLHTPDGSTSITLPLPGRHNAANALAAAALAATAGATLPQIQRALQCMQSVKGRLVTKAGLNGSVILDDSYNASPASFKAAIDVLAGLPGIRIIVGGDMAELGTYAVEGHREVGAFARSQGIEHFFATGVLMREALAAFGPNGTHADGHIPLANVLRPLLKAGVSVLVKGSRSAGMERVVQLLTAADGDRED